MQIQNMGLHRKFLAMRNNTLYSVYARVNPNWHEGDTFISFSFLDQILSAEFLGKISKYFWR